MNKIENDQGGRNMETIIRIETTANGFAHWIRTNSGIVIIEFVEGK